VNGEVVAYLLAAVASLVTAFVLFRKAKPERNDITITSADKVNAMTLRFAGVVDADNDDLRAQLRELSAKLTRLGGEFEQYRADTDARLAEQAVQVREARAGEVEATRKANLYAAENKELRIRVDSLEAEVTALKADRAV
jgi:outer membrane murein-binding lipoprotein Lpp